MKRPEPKGKAAPPPAPHGPTESDRADFDYYWQHLRRNAGYIMVSAGIWWNEEVYRSGETFGRLGKVRHSLLHQRREFAACCLLPTPLTRDIEDSDEALRMVLKSTPDFFQTPQWQTIKAKASAAEPVAFWNFAGPHRCAWRDYHDGEACADKLWKDPRDEYYERFALRQDARYPDRKARTAEIARLNANVARAEQEAADLKGIERSAKQHGRTVEEELKLKLAEWERARASLRWFDADRHDVGREFAWLHTTLEIAEQVTGDSKRVEYWAKQHGRTIEEERKVKETECEEARARMRRFLEAHPRMDFVADTRLPWATVSRALEAEWDRIKDLRRRVGLEANEQPPRKREWKKQLEIFDAYFPHWLENRKKIAALPRIWRRNLGFLESFKLLEVELTPEAVALARLMDGRGLKPKGVFKFTDRFLHDLEKASYEEAATRGLSGRSKATHGSGAKGAFDDESQPVAVTEFDYGAVDALLDGGEASDGEAGAPSQLNEGDLNMLRSWRPHFSIPKPKLPRHLAAMNADRRREWFTLARRRIEALWPPVDCDNL